MHGVAVAVLFAVAVAVAADGPKYTTKYDGVDLEAIINNERLLDSYFKCLMDKGKCTPDGAELKEHIRDALETECTKCSKKQKEGIEKMFEHFYKKKPEMLAKLRAKYDPTGEFWVKYQNEAEKRGWKIKN